MPEPTENLTAPDRPRRRSSRQEDLAEKYAQKAESLNFQIEKATSEIKNLYSGNLVAIAGAYTDLGGKEKARNLHQKAVEARQNLQRDNRFYLN